MTNYSNPRTSALVEDWPSGLRRVTAKFWIEAVPGKGERAVRVTTGKPVKLTFARRMRIVDGDDGRTYIVCATNYGGVYIRRGDMKYDHESAHHPNPRYHELMELFAPPEPMVNLKVVGPDGEQIEDEASREMDAMLRTESGNK